jgi:biopolymer transport protein ExbD/biopolymer transport protein TolR
MPKVQPIPEAGRLGRGHRVATSLAEINVVPLVDVMLVLLIIFMVTAPMIQRGVDVHLPVATRTQQIQGERVFVTVPANYRQSHLVFLGDEPIRVDVIQERVRQKIETLSEKKVYLRGDGSVTLQELMEVLDKLKGAGVLDVGIVNRLPGER